MNPFRPLRLLIVFGAVAPPALAQERPVVGLIPKAQKPIKMDGKLTDWGGAFVTPVHVGHPDFANRGGQFLYLWDETNLYVGLRCLDRKPAHVAPDNQIWNGDAVEFYLEQPRRQFVHRLDAPAVGVVAAELKLPAVLHPSLRLGQARELPQHLVPLLIVLPRPEDDPRPVPRLSRDVGVGFLEVPVLNAVLAFAAGPTLAHAHVSSSCSMSLVYVAYDPRNSATALSARDSRA
jgi:hypothetical protein